MSQVEGRNPVLEALKEGRVKKLFVAVGQENQEKIQEILEIAAEKRVSLDFVEKARLNNMSRVSRHQGVIGITEAPTYSSLRQLLFSTESRDLCVVVLDRVQDPQNLGNVLRTAEAVKADMVVVPERNAVGLTPAVERASMGGSSYVPIARENLHRALKMLGEDGIRIISVDPAGTSEYFSIDLRGPVAFVFGGEGTGINPTLLGRSDIVVRIPMMGRVSTLNVSSAVAIVLFERLRQMASHKDR